MFFDDCNEWNRDDAAGPPVLREAVFTAFGESVSSSGSADTRYGYAGAWGYETAESFDPLEELGWLHVGHRYYDPASGRFVQRDPIGTMTTRTGRR